MYTAYSQPGTLLPIPYSLVPIPLSLFPAFVIQITVSTNSPLFGVQSHQTNALDRFFFARVCVQVL